MNDEILRIQKMVAEKKITPEESVELIESICFARAGERPPPANGNWESLRTVKRSSTDRVIGGVCGGLGAVTPIPSWMWRVLLLVAFFSFGVGLLLYVMLWICMPSDTRSSLPPPTK